MGYYILLHRAFDNAGDWLILKRAHNLIRRIRPDRKIFVGKAWEPLETQFDLKFVNGAKAILIAGGPGYVYDTYPKVYPLVANLCDLQCPVISIGCGWNAWPGHMSVVRKYKFSHQTMNLLMKMNSGPCPLGCRGVLTTQVLRSNGINRVTMVGDPAWYDLSSLGRPFQGPAQINRIVFTVPADVVYHTQAKELIGLLSREFPDTEVIVSLHAKADRAFGETMRKLGYPTVDVSGNAENMEYYHSSDLHVGYRLHAHLFFLSNRKPSYLVAEDFRGLESLLSLGLFGLAGWNLGLGARFPMLKHIHPSAVRCVRGRLIDHEVPALLINLLKEDVRTHFARFSGLGAVLDYYYGHCMKPFIDSLP